MLAVERVFESNTGMDLIPGAEDLTAGAVLSRARELRVLERQVGAAKLVRATEWADLHPAADDDESAWPDWSLSLPRVAWDAPAEFAVAFGLSTDAGRDLIHEALEVRHRLPRVWRRLVAGELDGWRARRITQFTLHEPDDVVRAVDIVVAPIAHKVGVVTSERLLVEALLRLHPAEALARSRQRLDGRYVRSSTRCHMRV